MRIDFLDAETVNRALDFEGLVEALAEAHRQPEPLVTRSLLEAPPELERPGEAFLLQTAWAPGRTFGTKVITLVPANSERNNGFPTIQAIYPIFDGDTGEPRAIIDGTVLTLWKTAADSALGSSFLSRPGSEVLVMIGAGALASPVISAHMAVRPSLKKVLLWNRSSEKRDTLLRELLDKGIDTEARDDLEAAVGEADIVSAATGSTEPIVHGAWLKPGTHVDLIGAYTPEMRECDDETVRRASIFVDFRGSTVEAADDLTQPIADGVIDASDVRADLYQLVRGNHPGRTNDDEITLYKNAGGGHLDLFTAEYIASRAGNS